MHDPEACLFFARAPPDVTVEELTSVFSQHGPVVDVSWWVQSHRKHATSSWCFTYDDVTRIFRLAQPPQLFCFTACCSSSSLGRAGTLQQLM
jgi:hypothetical protein